MRRYVEPTPPPSDEETERADAITEVDLPIAERPERMCICRQSQQGALVITPGCIVHDPAVST